MKTLERTLGLSAVISVSISSMLGSGIFVLPGVAFAQTGPSTYLAYMLAALCVLPAAMSKSELATAMPTSGGTYVYLERTFGPLVGTVAGLGLWLSLLLKSAFALIGIGAYLSVITHWPLIPTVEMVLLGIVLLNLFGVGKVSKSIIVVVVLCILGLLTLIGLGFVKAEQGHMEPFMTEGVEGFFAATALVFVSYAGVTKVAAIAEEVKSPERNLPRGILVSLAIVSILYALVSYVLGLLFPQAAIADNLKPIHTMAQYLGGEVLGVVIAVLAILTMASMANAGLLAASRFPFAMARDRLLPYFVGRLHQRFLTPVWSIIFSGIVVAASVFTLDVGKIAKLASAFILLIYLMENIAVIVLRELRVQWYKPKYKSPLYPWVQIFGVLSTGVLLLSMKSLVVVAILTIGVPGLLIYFLYAQRRIDRVGVIGFRGVRKDLIEKEDHTLFQNRLEFLELTGDANVVVALFGKERSPEVLIEMGASLTEGGKLEVAHVTEIPEQTTFTDIADESPQVRALRRRINALAVKQNVSVRFDPILAHDVMKTIHQISSRLHCDWLVTEWGGRSRGTFTLHNPIGWLRNHLQCNLITFRDTGVRYVRKVLVVIQGGDYDRLVLSTADQFARNNEAKLTVVKVVGTKLPDREVNTATMLLSTLVTSCCHSQTETQILRSDKRGEDILSLAVEFDLLVLGTKQKQTLWETHFGTEVDNIIAQAPCSVVSVQAGREI